MYLYNIATEYNGPLEAAHAQIDDDGYVMVDYCSSVQPTLVLFQISSRLYIRLFGRIR